MRLLTAVPDCYRLSSEGKAMTRPNPYSDLMRAISREEYEADLKANPLDEDGNPRTSGSRQPRRPVTGD